MKILLTGSKGFLGSNILAYFQKKCYNIVGITEDIRDKEALRPYFKDAEFVIHSAGKTNDQNNEKICYEVNVLGTKNVVELCQEYGCKLIHFSSTARKTQYGKSKQESQKLVENAKELKVVIMRLCPIVKMDDPLMVWGRRYPIENLVVDVENIILTHDFNKELIDYKKLNEKLTNLRQSRP